LLCERVKLDPSGRLVRRLELLGAALWSPAQPALHGVVVRLADDDLRARIGVRKIELRERRLWINGSPVELRGVNRHQSHPLFGHALPDSVNLADLALLRELGAN